MRLLRESIMRSGRFTASECLIHSIFIQRGAIKSRTEDASID